MFNHKQNTGATTSKGGNATNNAQELSAVFEHNTSSNPQGQISQTAMMEQIRIVSENMANMQQTQQIFMETLLAIQYCLTPSLWVLPLFIKEWRPQGMDPKAARSMRF